MRKNYFSKTEDNNSSPGKSLVYFFVGIILASMGIFLIMQNTTVYSGFTLADIIGFNPPFGLVMLPIILGIGLLFFNGRSILGWLLTIIGIVIILLGILMGLRISFRPVPLYNAILMYGLTAAGIGLCMKGLWSKKG